MKSHFHYIQKLRKIFQKQWHWFACAGIVLLASVRKSWNEPHLSRPDAADPSELPTKKPATEIDDQPVIKFTEKAPIAGTSAETEAKISFPKTFEKKAALPAFPVLPEAEKAAFLERFGKTAISEKRKFGIPASVILASGLVQSFAGRRDLAKSANNFYGLAAAENAILKVELGGRSYQKFGTAWDSFRAHSILVNAFFQKQKKPAISDWRAWTQILAQKSGYVSVENWEKEVAAIIETYDLADLDK